MDNKKANKRRVLDLYRKRAGYTKQDIATALAEADAKIEECKKNKDETGVLVENKRIGKFMLNMNLEALHLMNKNADNTFIRDIVKNELYSLIVLENKLQFDDTESLKVATNKIAKEQMANVHDLHTDMQKESMIMNRDIKLHTQNIIYSIIKYDKYGDMLDHYKLLYAFMNNVYHETSINDMNEVINKAREDKRSQLVAEDALNKFEEKYEAEHGTETEGHAIEFALSNKYITVQDFVESVIGSNKVAQSMKDIPLLKTVESGKVLYAEFCDKLVIEDIEFDYALLSKAYYENTIPESKRLASEYLMNVINYHDDKTLNTSLRTAILNGANEIMNKTVDKVAKAMNIPTPNIDTDVIEDARILAIAYTVAETINTMLLDKGLISNGIILTKGFYDDMIEANTVFADKVTAVVNKFIEGKTDFDLNKTVKPNEKEEVLEESID